jgi:Cu2+-exporting ATPase
VAEGVRETPGSGLSLDTPEGEIRLGSRRFTGASPVDQAEAPGPELWLARPGRDPVRFAFTDALRPDAVAVVRALKAQGKRVHLLSGDRRPAVAAVAQVLGIEDWHAERQPADKAAFLESLAAEGRTVMMVGDGLNDAPALAAASVSMSPSTAVDVSQTAADVVFQGTLLRPITEVLDVSRRADKLVRQNFALALLYNVFTVPLAMAGMVTPLIAALAMSSSSLVVIANALRLARRRAGTDEANGRTALPDPGRPRPGSAGPRGLPVVSQVRPV